jgi:shikimate dehydrogenase
VVLNPPEPVLSADARQAAVLGSPISHSLSPALHLAAYRALGLSSWSYRAHEMDAAGLPGFVAGLGPQWAGLSLTMPLKEVAFDVADEVSDLAREVGAINTLVRCPDGGWRGENTDVYGAAQALREAGCSRVDSAVVLGSGATARSVVAALVTLGCSRVTFAVRSAARQQTLDQAVRAGLDVDVISLDQLSSRGAEVVVSTLPAGALPASVPPADAVPAESQSAVPHSGRRLLLDVVYAGWPTPLAQRFEEAGAGVVSGFEMLLHQAAEQVSLMTGVRPPIGPMRAAGLAAMADTNGGAR